MNNKRLYKKIMDHINKRSNCSIWDFRTLNICYPHLAQQILLLLKDYYDHKYSYSDIKNTYIPQNIF